MHTALRRISATALVCAAFLPPLRADAAIDHELAAAYDSYAVVRREVFDPFGGTVPRCQMSRDASWIVASCRDAAATGSTQATCVHVALHSETAFCGIPGAAPVTSNRSRLAILHRVPYGWRIVAGTGRGACYYDDYPIEQATKTAFERRLGPGVRTLWRSSCDGDHGELVDIEAVRAALKDDGGSVRSVRAHGGFAIAYVSYEDGRDAHVFKKTAGAWRLSARVPLPLDERRPAALSSQALQRKFGIEIGDSRYLVPEDLRS